MRFVASWSGGKDSTASIILAHEHNEPLDAIVFSEVMFDLKNKISGENPRHIKFIRETAKPLFESWGYSVEILHADRDYLDFFNRIIERPTKHLEHRGMRFGFPVYGRCGIKRDLKLKPIQEYYRKIKEPVVQYVGICADEKKRLEAMHRDRTRISLLEKYGYTEKMSMEKCEEYGLLSPGYELSKRGGCWFCPNAKLPEMGEIKRIYPEAWRRFVSLEERVGDVAYPIFNPFRQSLHEIDAQLELEKA